MAYSRDSNECAYRHDATCSSQRLSLFIPFVAMLQMGFYALGLWSG